MKISIVTVTYNSEAFVKNCIISVLSQTYDDIEYIIVDGASTDKTMDIVKSFKNIRFISEKDNGIYDAINKGIALATGDVIGILNSDDFFADDNVVKRIVQAFKENIDMDAVFADVMFVQNSDTSKTVRYYSSANFRPFMFRYGFQIAHPTFYVKRILFEKYGHYRTDLKIAGDFELLLRFLFINKVKYKYINDLWVKMRIGGVSTSGMQSILKLNKEIIKSCRGNNIYTNNIMVYSKYLVKWWGYIFKNQS